MVVPALLGAALVSGRRRISELLFPCDDEVELEAVPSMDAFLVALLGVWLTITSIARAAQVELSLFSQFSLHTGSTWFGDKLGFLTAAEAWSQRAPWIITLCFGVFLVVRADGLVRAWNAFRAAGHDR